MSQPELSEPAPRKPSSSPLLAAGVALLVIIGSLMSWVTVISVFGSISVSGFDAGDGKITLAGGLVTAALVATIAYRNWRPKPTTAFGVAVSLATLGTALYDTIHAEYEIHTNSGDAQGLASVHVGTGLWLTDLAAIGLVYLMVRAAMRAFTDQVAFSPLVNPAPVIAPINSASQETIDLTARAVRRLPVQRSAEDAERRAAFVASVPAQVVREWARDSGYDVSNAGPISRELRLQYALEHES